ncbi:hypothetical protein SLE2022_192630 [Rubroshorea leprosula]
MGASTSKQEGCLGFLSKTKKNSKQRRTRRISLHPVDDVESRHSTNYFRRTMQGDKSPESPWFDRVSVFEFEVDEVFCSPPADIFSRNVSEISLSISSSRDSSPRGNECISCTHPSGEGKKSKEVPHHDLECIVVGEIDKDAKNSVESRGEGGGGILIQHLVPRYHIVLQKRKCLIAGPISIQVLSRFEKGTTLGIKKMEFAPNCAAYYPFVVDVFLSQRKINHIARFVHLPTLNLSEEAPSVLVMPLYPATLFQSENDGEGIILVLYFKLSESYSKELPSHFQENIIRLINNGMEGSKGLFADNITPFRERLKILGQVANLNDLPLSKTEKKLMNVYNDKPVLSRPQGENYFEIDLDLHRFSFVARKGFETFGDKFKLCILDFGLTIQGNKAEDLPENMLCCIRLNEIDYSNHKQLEF